MQVTDNPSSYNAEVVLLGTILAYGHLIHKVGPRIGAYMFETTPHKTLYEAMQKCAKEGADASSIFIVTKLKERGSFDNIGGQNFLDSLMEHRERQENIQPLMTIVQDEYKRRELKKFSATIPGALATGGSPNKIISSLSNSLNKLLEEIGTPDVVKLSDVLNITYNDVLERRKNPGIQGFSTGFENVDKRTGGFLKGDIWYIASRPSHGKSSWALKACMNMAQDGNPVLMINREMSIGSIGERMLSIASGIPLQDIRMGDIPKESLNKFEEGKEMLVDLPIFIDNNFIGQIDYIIAVIRKYHQLYKIKVVAVDYIQLIVDRTSESVHLLGDASRRLKLLANELEITVLILSQVNRECEKREDKRPLMADLRQSGNMEEDADFMVALYREKVYNDNPPEGDQMEFIFRKCRNAPIGTELLRFDDDTVNVKESEFDLRWSDSKGFLGDG
jgi:replicative DNA helicase